MRRVAPLSFSLLGLGLALAIPGACQAQASKDVAAGLPSEVKIGRLCDACASKLPKRIPVVVDGPGAIHPGLAAGISCSHCPGGVAPSVSTGPVVASDFDAPGYAQVGGGPAPSEFGDGPAPIGVMRTNFAHPAAALPSPTAPVASPIAPAMTQNIIPPPSPDTSKRRPRILSKLLGLPDFSMLGASQRERKRENHAATRYDTAESVPTSLPASMVYGR